MTKGSNMRDEGGTPAPRRRRSWRPSGAMVLATFALLFSLTGGAGAIVRQITGAQIVNHSITGADIRPHSLIATDFAAGAVVHGAIGHGQVQTDDLADGAVTTDKLADGAVSPDKLADGAVTSRALASASVGRNAIAANSVTSADIMPRSVGSQQLAPEPQVIYVGEPGGPAFQHGATQPRSIAQFSVGPHAAKVGFYKDLEGDVHLVGEFNFVPGSTAFTLPSGYAPPADLTFGAGSLNGDTIIKVGTDGSVGAYPVDSFLGNLGLEDLVLVQDITWRPDQLGITSGGG
jgi:hypothetical protein